MPRLAPMSAVVGSVYAAVIAPKGGRHKAFVESWNGYSGNEVSASLAFFAGLGYLTGYLMVIMPTMAFLAVVAPGVLMQYPWGGFLFCATFFVPLFGGGYWLIRHVRTGGLMRPTLKEDLLILAVGGSLTILAVLVWPLYG